MADPEILKRGQKTMYQPCRHLSYMHTRNYMPYGKKWHNPKKILSQQGAATPIPLNPPLNEKKTL